MEGLRIEAAGVRLGPDLQTELDLISISPVILFGLALTAVMASSSAWRSSGTYSKYESRMGMSPGASKARNWGTTMSPSNTSAFSATKSGL